MTDQPFPTDDGSSTVDFTTGAPSLDTIWLDLDGDLEADVAITVTDLSGPFAVEPSYDDPFLLPAGDDGAPTSLLAPWDAGAGFADPWALPADGADWTSFQSFDPMSAGSDWTVDGGWSVPGVDSVDGGSFDSTWLSDPGSYYDSSSYWDSSGYWDNSGYYEATGDSFSVPTDAAGTGIYDAGAYDASGYESADPGTGYDVPGVDTTGYDNTGYDAGDMTTDSWTDTWTTTDTEWVSPAWDIEGASAESNMWMDTYDDLAHGPGGEWDLWNASVDAYLNGDSDLSYQLQQESIAAGSAADQAWTYSNEAWSDPSYFPDSYPVTTETTYDATYYDTTSYDTTSYDTSYSSSYDTTSYDTTSYDTSTDY